MELLTIQDTAQLLKVSPVTVRRFIADGTLPAVRVGKGVRVRKEAIDQLARPIEPQKPAVPKPARKTGRPMTADDPLSKLVGSVTDVPPSDSSKKHEYLAEVHAPTVR